MAIQLLRYLVLFLVLCNIPGFLLVYTNPSLSSAVSILTSLSLLLFFFLSKPWQKPIIPFVLFTILYFTISSLNYYGVDADLIKEFIRFLILVVCITEVMYRSSYKELFYILLIGAFSVILNALVFPYTNAMYGLVTGRYSGFFLNPNTAGIICLLGIAISYSIKNSTWRILGQLVFTLAGILTLSRTFIVVWLFINFLAIIKDRKNLFVPIIGVIALIVMITFTDSKIFAADRFEALTAFFGEGEVKTKTVGNDSRTQTWALYYDLIFEKPLVGHGYGAFQKVTTKAPGVHNSYLMIIGESGIIPFLLFIGTYIYMLRYCIIYLKQEPYLLYTLLVVLLNLMASHTFFSNYQSIALTIFIFMRIRMLNNPEKLEQRISNLSK
ncbi:O-antigen ligase family protein [Maribacter arcticus]|uniref:O-antigen ligase family protein n=1 Tax=Maribacter arcticus TaxID=561365 RepID=UPI00300347FA